MRPFKRKLETNNKLMILVVVLLLCLFPQAGGASIAVTNPSFESGSTGWSGSISTGNSEYYSPVDGTHYAKSTGGAGYTYQQTNHSIATGETYTLTVWARSTNGVGNTAATTAEVQFYYGSTTIDSVTQDVNPARLLGAPRTESNDDGGNVWIDNGYRHEFADIHMYQELNDDPLADPWYACWDDYDDYKNLEAWAVGPVIVPGHKWVYGDYADDNPSTPFAEIRFIQALSGGTPAYNWTNDYTSVLYTDDGDEDPWVIDPHLYYDDATGRLWMSWGGGTIWVCEMDPTDGRLINHPSDKNYNAHPEHHTAVAYWNGDEWTGSNHWFEGPALYKHNGYWYLFGSYGNLGANYTIRGGRGTSPTGPFYDKDGVALTQWDSSESEYGNSIFLGHEGGQNNPGHPYIWEESGTFYMGYDYTDEYTGSAIDRFGIRRLYWVDDWPTIWTPITVTFYADNYPDAIGQELGIAFRNTGTGSDAAFDYVSLTYTIPEEISTPEQLNQLGNNPDNQSFILTADIDMNGYSYTAALIAPDANNSSSGFQGTGFTGIFDGNNHIISNLNCAAADGDYVGLFGYVSGTQAQVKDLTLLDPNISGRSYVGALLGKLAEGKITNCNVQGGRIIGDDDIGGLIGRIEGNLQTEITNCFADDCNVTGGTRVGILAGSSSGTIQNCYAQGNCSVLASRGIGGGLLGYNDQGLVTECFSLCNINGGGHIGGLIGATDYGNVANCYSLGSVDGLNMAGGLIGYNHYGPVENCYAAVDVSAGNPDITGALVGDDVDGIFQSCFWDSDVNPDLNGIGNAADPNVIGKTTAELQTESTFTNVGWDFLDIWEFRCEGMNYPRLIWQTTNPPDYLCPDGVGFEDYAVFAQQWLNTACGLCGGADLTGDGNVDYYDLQLFVEQWLQNP